MLGPVQTILDDRRLSCGALALLSAMLLAGALGSQYLGGLEPCSLCVIQRFPHVAVIVFGWLGFKQGLTDDHRKRLLWLIGLCLLGTAGVGFWHAGIEYGLYSGPSACTGTAAGTTVEALREQLMTAEIVRCDEIPWSLFGISMAGYNGLISFVAAITAFYAARNREETA